MERLISQGSMEAVEVEWSFYLHRQNLLNSGGTALIIQNDEHSGIVAWNE